MEIVVIKGQTHKEQIRMQEWFDNKFGKENIAAQIFYNYSLQVSSHWAWACFFEKEDAILFKMTWG